MAVIIQGTTPTIVCAFSLVDTSDLTKIFLTFKPASGNVALQKDIDDATIEEKSASWQLTQAETIQLCSYGHLEMMINWLTDTGVRGATPKTTVVFEPNHIPEVI